MKLLKISPLVVVAFFVIFSAGCSRNQLTGVVQRSEMIQGGYVLTLGSGPSSDFVFLESHVLLDLEGLMEIRRRSENVLFLGNRYVGKRIKVYGEIDRTESGRRYIRVTHRDQIEILSRS